MNRRNRTRDAVLVFAGVLGMAGLAWAAGFGTALLLAPAPGPTVPPDVAAPENFALYGEVWKTIEHEFYGENPDPAAVTDGAIEGLVDALDDPHAAFVPAGTVQTLDDAFLPQFVHALGAWVEPVTQGALVVSTEPGSPAAGALVAGDIVVAVGEEELEGLDHEALVDQLSGEAGTEVRLIVLHANERGEALDVTLADVPAPPPVSLTRPEPGVAYLRLSHFDADLVPALDAALGDLEADPPDSLVVDVRDNPGGDTASLRAALGRFFEGDAWIEVGHDGAETAVRSDASDAPDFEAPNRIVVLVNEGTASAAEIFAGGLRDVLGARLVGQATFGKGSLQAVTSLGDGSLLRLTTGSWQTPAGTAVDGGGLAPDLEVAATAEDRGLGRDAQLDAAIDAARGAALTDRDGAGSGG